MGIATTSINTKTETLGWCLTHCITLKPVALPLTKDVGEAIMEYILAARPETDYENVFLRVRPPFRPFANGGAIGDVYDYYRLRVGLPRIAYDGKGFHSLRRAVGTNLVTSGGRD